MCRGSVALPTCPPASTAAARLPTSLPSHNPRPQVGGHHRRGAGAQPRIRHRVRHRLRPRGSPHGCAAVAEMQQMLPPCLPCSCCVVSACVHVWQGGALHALSVLPPLQRWWRTRTTCRATGGAGELEFLERMGLTQLLPLPAACKQLLWRRQQPGTAAAAGFSAALTLYRSAAPSFLTRTAALTAWRCSRSLRRSSRCALLLINL